MFQPDHAYLPGINKRHPDSTFEEICATARVGASTGELAESSAFQHGLYYIEHGFYWEAHEVLEAVWMALPADSDERLFLQGLIQLANALLKQRMGRPNAVLRLCHITRNLFASCDAPLLMGVDPGDYKARIDQLEMQ